MIILSILGLAVLILAHEAGHFFAARSVGVGVKEFAIGFPPRWFRRKKGETEYTIGVLPLGGFVRLEGETPGEEANPERSFSNHSVWARSWVLVAGVIANFILAALLFATAFMIGAPREIIFSGVASQSPAAAVGLEFGDAVLSLNGGEINTAEQFIAGVENNRGQEIILEIRRGEEIKSVRVMPRLTPPAGEGPLGVAVGETGWKSQGFFSALISGFKETVDYSVLIVSGLWRALTESGATNLSGPIGVAAVAGQAGELGIAYLAHFFGLLSINLAILNILPLPALDGGRLFLVLGEAIFRRRVPARAERIWNALGISLLLLLMFYVTVQDLIRLF
jgi:regulator of sigma E protease